jgi:hypothetical protein
MRKISYVLAVAIASILMSLWTTAVQSNNTLVLAEAKIASDRDFRNKSVRLSANDRTYFFTMQLPERAGKGFTQLSFTEQTQTQGSNFIQFDLAQTKAFTGTPNAIGRPIGIKSTWVDETGTIWVEFNSALPPSTTLTVVFQAQKSPVAKSYEYGIAAYPEAKQPVAAVYVGNGTLTVR